MKLLQYIRIWILFGLCVFLTDNLHAQLSACHSIMFPYDNPNRVIYSAGSLTYSAADYSANIQSNPVSFSFVEKPQIFFILNQDISRYHITDIRINKTLFNNGNNDKERKLDPEYKLYPIFISCTLPLNVANQRIFLSASLNKIQMPEHEVRLTGNEYPGLDPELDFHHQRDGHVWNATMNIGYQFPLNINLGITWSQWFGSYHWYDYNTSQSVIGEGKFKYDGNNFSIGLLKKYKDHSISISYHAPLTLMKADDIYIKNMGEDKYTLQQKFDGAFKLGIAFILNDKSTLSFGYRYQNKFSIEGIAVRYDKSREIKYEYSNSHQIAIAYEYIVYFKGKKLPVFLSYWADWLPKKSGFGQLNIYQDFSGDYHYQLPELYENIAGGICFPFYFLNIHLTGQLNLYPISVTYLPLNYTHIIPPLSFDAKRMNVIFNFGVSYAFKR
ncbi:MAG: hypothetical protein ISS19_05390 [Bacteroidales bacterium]|nr:hypothetical protein [Bacteroidales bacterium]